MCVIAACDSNYRPTKKELEKMFYTNPDGAGIAWVENNKVNIAKGLMSFNELNNAVNKWAPKNSPMIIHCRIGTSGGYSPEITHPYPITNNLGMLHALDVCCNLAVAHNGVIANMPTNKQLKISDTVSYIKRVIYPILIENDFNSFVKDKHACKTIAKKAAGNRFCVLDSNANMRIVGNGWTNLNKGIKVSNRLFLAYTAPKYTKYNNTKFSLPTQKDHPIFSNSETSYYDLNTDMYALPNYCRHCGNAYQCSITYPLCNDVYYSSDVW